MSSNERKAALYRENRKRRMDILNERRQRRRTLDVNIPEASTSPQPATYFENQTGLCKGKRKVHTCELNEDIQLKRRMHSPSNEASTSRQPPDTQIQDHYRGTCRLDKDRQHRRGMHSPSNEASTSRHPPDTQTKKQYRGTEYRFLGDLTHKCPHCDAIMWYDERVKSSSTSKTSSFSMCCREGQVHLDKMMEAPEFLDNLMKSGRTKDGAVFKRLIRSYNSCYAFTSMGAKIDRSMNMIPGKYVFRISGQVLYRIGSLLPVDDTEPSYAQLYVYDTTSETAMREKTIGKKEGSPKLDQEILLGLKDMLEEVNPLAQTFRMAQERLRGEDDVPISIRLLGTREQKDRVYNAPTASEIAALIVDGSGDSTRGRDIIIEHKSEGLQSISELHPSYMALQYPLLFPYGEDSYHIGILYHIAPKKGKKRKRKYVTMREYYAYRIQQRASEGNTLLRGGRLFQQFLVDCCCAIESERLWYIKNNQEKFRCDMLNNLCDAVTKGDSVGQAVGKRMYILPSSFTGGPRYMQQNYQDAMAICRWYGNPHLFITFTVNKRWPEIDSMLQYIDDQTVDDRPDIVARVFKLKLKQLMNCLKTERYFGTTVADVYTIEFQKRGMPHAHILLWLNKEEVDLSPAYIDSIIHAEIPDIDKDPELHATVTQFMVHGPCGQANPNCICMKKNKCSKNYPKSFNEETTFDNNGYPLYRRRKNNRTIQKGQTQLDNRSIVPYNPGLLLMFDAHINVEWCNNARAIKYLFKYISKGADKATMVIKDDVQDEIKAYLDCRYLSASEAAWRILEFDIQERYPSVMRLPVHLEGEQAVIIKDDDKLNVVINRASQAETKLTSWMSTNATDANVGKLSYAQFLTHYVWKDGSWIKRKQGQCIGRIAYVHPTAGERYYLRLLLNIVKGPKSYDDIKTVNGFRYSSFKDACYALGLLNNDKEWNDAMHEANQWAMPSQLRELYVTMLLFCEITDVNNLWESSYSMLSDDIEMKKRKQLDLPTGYTLPQQEIKTYTLMEIDKILMRYGKRLSDIKNMPQLKDSDMAGMGNRLIMEERMYDRSELHNEWVVKVQQLNKEQQDIHDTVIDAVTKNQGGVMFVYGHGGTGKTFLYGTIAARLRAEQKIVLNVASSGIAALLLPGGRTAHSRFEIPIDLFEDSTCNIRQGTQLAELLQQASLIIWDEAPMDHRFAFEALDRTLRDIVGFKDPGATSKMFGGKVVLLGGDFRQVLPIISKAGRQEIVQASINRSYIWRDCKVFILKTSMRVRETEDNEGRQQRVTKFNDWLLALGDGRLETKAESSETENTWINIPHEYICGTGKISIQQVVNDIYPNFIQNSEDDDYLRERAILTPLNEDADYINDYMTDYIPGDYKLYKSCDEICASSMDNVDQFTTFPTEYLNTLHLQGLPKHELKLKIGMPVMLLRNINPSRGLCNGTRLIVTYTGKFIVEGRIITGSQVGNHVLIPRIMMTSNDTKIPFILKRRQYPLKPCYAMTINKSQGQSLTHVGVYLPKPVFSHGQLYVAASRTTSPEGLKFYIDDSTQAYKGHTRNVVFKEVFSNLPTVE